MSATLTLPQATLRRREAGFTLVELLIAFTILALVLPLAFNGFRVGAHVWARTEALDKSGDLNLVRDFLQRQIGSAYPAFVDVTPTTGRVKFIGTRDRLEFVAPTPAAAGGAGMSHFVLETASSQVGRGLVMEWRPEFGNLQALDSVGISSNTVLIDAVAGLEFAYYGTPSKTAPLAWYDEWSGLAVLPQLVRIRLIFPSGDRRTWLDLMVRPMVSMDAGCVYDPVGKSCRGRLQ